LLLQVGCACVSLFFLGPSSAQPVQQQQQHRISLSSCSLLLCCAAPHLAVVFCDTWHHRMQPLAGPTACVT
jgi:hypothetical protein